MNEDELIEQVAGAFRPRGVGELRYLPAWHDLSPDARARAADAAVRSRELEAGLDPQGLSTTARAVLAVIRSAHADR